MLEEKQHEKVLNLVQDICAAIANIKTAKQIGTAIHIMKQTCSKDTVTLLSRFGNCISYDTQRYITSVAKEEAKQEQDTGFFVPSNIHMGVFTQFAVDNLDFHENSHDGKTMHGTTHIVYQYQSDPSTQTQASAPVHRLHSVSIDAPEICEPMQSMLTPNDQKQGRSIRGMKLQHEDAQPNSKEARNLNTLYKLGQIGSTDLLDFTSEMEPATWKEFHKKFIEQSSVQTTIGYGPFVPKPPTNPDVVMERWITLWQCQSTWD